MSGEKTLLYYSIPDIIRAYRISKETLKTKIFTGEILAIKQLTSIHGGETFKYLIPKTELVKLEHLKKSEPVASKMSQPEYYEEKRTREINLNI